ncbi:hypothetical protein ACLMAL_39545 [Nocardia sp. CWNU-33]|uniref:hypothetical protein n=1 Tax=Nocardia sp. CWNU-33 TaxID=3392117 RepID=UPI00398EE8D2
MAPPGISSSSSRCRRLTVLVRAMGEFVAAIGQHAQRHQVIVGSHSQQIRSMQGYKGNRVRVGGVGLTALTGGEHSCPGR